MTAPPTTGVPPGLAVILRPVREYDGPEPFDARAAAKLLGVERRTVVSWATDGRLGGLKLDGPVGWRFALVDIEEFLIARYHTRTR